LPVLLRAFTHWSTFDTASFALSTLPGHCCDCTAKIPRLW